tara:strand:+ start:607 stop:1242 length:636 start_codon:yes stop_codon:yes gene_type:complete
MKVLDLFSGTHSVGKVCEELGYEVVSLDLTKADYNVDIMDFDYKSKFKPKEFDIVWASPPCVTFSVARLCWLGQKTKYFGDKIITREMLENDMNECGLPILRKAEEIIKYLEPELYFIENPKTGRMKEFMEHHPHYDVDYCMYSNWGYKKSTRIWTNKVGFKPLLCNKKCGNMSDGKHNTQLGGQRGKRTSDVNRSRVPTDLIKQLILTQP